MVEPLTKFEHSYVRARNIDEEQAELNVVSRDIMCSTTDKKM